MVFLSAYAEDPGCKAGDECANHLLLRRAAFGEPRLRRDVALSLLRRTDLAEARRAKAGNKVPRALARGVPFPVEICF